MRKKITAALLSGLCILTVLLTGCSQTASVQNTQQNTPHVRIDISNLDEAYDAILNDSTVQFIGYHVVDEAFLSWFLNQYGKESLELIAAYATDTDASIWYQVTGKTIHVLWLDYCSDLGFQNVSTERVYPMECAKTDEVVLDFSGDLTMADDVATTAYLLSKEDGLADCFSEDLLAEMKQADVMVVNNEFAYTTRGEAIPGKAYTFRGTPARVQELSKIGADLVGLANNHVYDYGEIGLLDTIDTVEKSGLPYVGAGRNLQDACKPVYFVANGRKIAVVSATQIERSYTYTRQATETSAGVLKTLDSKLFCRVIGQAKRNADHVIVFVHWGTEGDASFSRDQEQLARDFVDAGADAIVGGHTHCLQGMEYIEGVPVFYSLGNYMFSITGSMPADYDTGLAQLRIGKDGKISAGFIPCHFSAGVTSMVTDAEKKQEIFQYLESLSRGIRIDEEGEILQAP